MADERLQLNAENNELERALAALVLRGSSVDRDALMFEAGRQSALAKHRRRAGRAWLWPAATALSTSAAAILALMLTASPRAVERPSLVQQPEKTQHDSNDVEPTFDTDRVAALQHEPHDSEDVEAAAPDEIVRRTAYANSARYSSFSRPEHAALRAAALRVGIDNLPLPRPSGQPSAAAPTYQQERDRYLRQPS